MQLQVTVLFNKISNGHTLEGRKKLGNKDKGAGVFLFKKGRKAKYGSVKRGY